MINNSLPKIAIVTKHKDNYVTQEFSRFLNIADIQFVNDISELRNPEEVICVGWYPVASLPVLRDVFDACKNCIWVHSFTTGVDLIHPFLVDTLLNRNDVTVTNSKGSFSYSLAEYCFATIFHFEKQIPRIINNSLSRNWDYFTMDVIKNKTIGFIGYGDIAKTTAKLCKAFNMNILALRNTEGNKKGDEYCDVIYSINDPNYEDIFGKCDYIVSSLPKTPKTIKFFDKNIFKKMKPNCIFISIGRGAVVDEEDLVYALDNKIIANAVLDVFTVEPLDKDSKLWGRENVLITAHNADNSPDYIEMCLDTFYENFQCYLNNKPFVTVVSKESGY